MSGRRAVLALLVVAAVAGWASDSAVGSGLSILALATAPALFAVPPRGRVPLGLVVVLATGLAVTVSAGDVDLAGWVAAAVLAPAGALLAWRGPSWPAWSQRYERAPRPSAAAAEAPDLWKALDRGEDPTQGDQ